MENASIEYQNPENITQERTKEPWTIHLDELSGYHYYYNEVTGETFWIENENTTKPDNSKVTMKRNNKFNSISLINPCEHKESMEETMNRLAPERITRKSRFADLNPKILCRKREEQTIESETQKKDHESQSLKRGKTLGKYEMMDLEDFDPIPKGSISDSDTVNDFLEEIISKPNKKEEIIEKSEVLSKKKENGVSNEDILMEIFGQLAEVKSVLEKNNKAVTTTKAEVTPTTKVLTSTKAEVTKTTKAAEEDTEIMENQRKEKMYKDYKKAQEMQRLQEYTRILDDYDAEPNKLDIIVGQSSKGLRKQEAISPIKNIKNFQVPIVEDIPQTLLDDEIKRFEGYLLGHISILVTSKKVFKKWSKRFFTFQESKLKLWKNKTNFDYGYPPNQTISMKNIKVVTDLRKNTYDTKNTKKTKNNVLDNTKYCFELIRCKQGESDNRQTAKSSKDSSKYKISLVLSSEDKRCFQELNNDFKMVTLFNCGH